MKYPKFGLNQFASSISGTFRAGGRRDVRGFEFYQNLYLSRFKCAINGRFGDASFSDQRPQEFADLL
jgi:hypothetical protein